VGVRRLLRNIARHADARIFCVAGSGFRDEARLLRLAEGIHLTTSPRSANILLIVGGLDAGLIAPALVAHDALAAPRATVWWRLDAQPGILPTNFPDAVIVDDGNLVRALRRVHEELVTGQRRSDPALLPDVEPARWRGIGPYGQGGKAMTGGVPYGRPMAERSDARDGLKLDYLPVRIGPLFAPFPIGLALDVKLQGDVIQEAILENFTDPPTHARSIFHRALREPVLVRDLELQRARSHLHWLADAVGVIGSPSLGERVLRLSHAVGPGDGEVIRALERALRRRRFFGWSTHGVGILEPNGLEPVGGPLARASGVAIDARCEDPAYQLLGFEPVVQEEGDCAARWIQRLQEAAQALELAARAGDRRAGGSGIIESPRGSLTSRGGPSLAIASLVPSLVAGMEWGDAVATVVSLDLDMSEVNRLHDHASAAS
jgi:hypothetical protein